MELLHHPNPPSIPSRSFPPFSFAIHRGQTDARRKQGSLLSTHRCKSPSARRSFPWWSAHRSRRRQRSLFLHPACIRLMEALARWHITSHPPTPSVKPVLRELLAAPYRVLGFVGRPPPRAHRYFIVLLPSSKVQRSCTWMLPVATPDQDRPCWFSASPKKPFHPEDYWEVGGSRELALERQVDDPLRH